MKLEDIAKMNLAKEQPIEIVTKGSWIPAPITVGYFHKVDKDGDPPFLFYSTERTEEYGLGRERRILCDDVESITILERKSV